MDKPKSMRIQPIVVIYNTNCKDSCSVTALVNQNLRPIIVDNSTSDYGNSEFCRKNGLLYCSMGGNAGLSRAYNHALTTLPEEVDFVQWFDDDTMIPDDFGLRVQEYIIEHPNYDVYVPIVKSGEKNEILSPSLLVKAFTYKISDVSELNTKQFSAINSGMVIRRAVFNSFKYDENMFLDCIDHDFMCHCWKKGVPIAVITTTVLNQHFSGDEKKNRAKALRRYKVYSRDFKLFRQKNGCSFLSTEMILLKRLIRILV